MNNLQRVKFPPEQTGQRLDSALANVLGIPRSQSQRMIKFGLVLSETGEPLKSHLSIRPNFTVVVNSSTTEPVVLPEITVKILHEDEHIMVINKDSGQVSHPGVGQTQESIAEALIRANPKIEEARYTDSHLSYMRAGIVHRLDKDTSGVMIIAKTKEALFNLQQQFKDRSVRKKYCAVSYGLCQSQLIDAPIGRHPKYRRKQAVVPAEKGREAVTKIVVKKAGLINTFPVSYLVCYPQTGRMHQIRVHMSAHNNPLLGDVLYNTKKSRQVSRELAVPRLLLHAYAITFKHPSTSKKVRFFAPLPRDLSTYLHQIV